MRPEPEIIPVMVDAADALRGSQRRLFMAKAVKAMGRGGQRWALEHLGWCRDTISKGVHELDSGITCIDAFSSRRRKPAEEHLPRLLDDIRDIVDGQCQVNPQADEAPDMLRLSLDAKATVNIGPFSCKGRSRAKTEAADHDFKPVAKLTPFGIFLPEYDDLTFYMARSKVTSDFIVDRLEDWCEFNRVWFPEVTKLVLNLDNGPENHSRRTQFLKRMVGFAHEYRLDIELAYYPPYHSKYNPVERCWGILELHWNGAVLGYAETMTWKGGRPEVVLVEAEYLTGIRLGREEMEALESMITRLPTLEKWFVSIPGRPKKTRAS